MWKMAVRHFPIAALPRVKGGKCRPAAIESFPETQCMPSIGPRALPDGRLNIQLNWMRTLIC